MSLELYQSYTCSCQFHVLLKTGLGGTVSLSDSKSTSRGVWGFSGSSAGKESARNAGDLGLIPKLGRSSGEGNGYPLQCSGLENSIDFTTHGVTESWTRLIDFHSLFYFPEMSNLTLIAVLVFSISSFCEVFDIYFFFFSFKISYCFSHFWEEVTS